MDSLQATNGYPIVDNDFITKLREEDKKHRNPYNVIAQLGGQEHLLTTPADITIYGGSRGGGKCLNVNELVITPFGLRRIGDLKSGDIITGLDGGMQRVIYNSHNGVKQLYRVTLIDGSSLECSADHLWNVKRTCHSRKKRYLYNLDKSANWIVMSTEQMIEHMAKQKGKKRPSHLMIPLCEPVKFTLPADRTKQPNFDFYVYGALIGDGCITGNNEYGYIYLESMDSEVVEQFTIAGIDMSRVSSSHDSKSKMYTINNATLRTDLKYMGLLGCYSHDKFIPKRLLFGSQEERFALIQGLMDTDGYIDGRGHCSYSTVSKQLAEDVKFLINSLGGLATITKKKAGYKDRKGNYIQCRDSYEVYIRIKESHRLFRLTRKKELSKVYNGGVSDYGRRIVSIEPTTKGEVCCIAVTNQDSMYMAGDFIVTHNSFGILLDALNDVWSGGFRALILRKEKNDLSDMIETSYGIFSQFGSYNKSKDDMTWNFNNGGFLKFDYFADSFQDFKQRFQGKQFSYIAVDEITHMEYEKFRYIISDNRNTAFLRSHFIGSCNPDPESWVAGFIGWWLDDEGYPIPERDGKVRYCFMDGDDISTIVWGNTRQEVYAQCSGIINRYWKPEYIEFGRPEELFIKSVCFIQGKLSDNKILLRSDATYLANLANQTEESRARDLDGNWKYKEVGKEILKLSTMEKWFENPRHDMDDTPFASCDIAVEGGDNLVLCLWKGNRTHLADIFVCRHNSKVTLGVVKGKLEEWGVPEQNFTYDLNGLGQLFKGFFPRAVPFINNAGVDQKYRYVYANMKSQAAYMFAQSIINGEMSIEPGLLDRRFSGSGYSNLPLSKILLNERRIIRQDESNTDNGFALPKKRQMKAMIGHSPDFIESMFMIMIFSINKNKSRVRHGWGFL